MFAFVIVAFSALSSTQSSGLVQRFQNIHLSAKFGAGLPEYGPQTKHLDLVDQHASRVAERYVQDYMFGVNPDFYNVQTIKMYGPIENIAIPGLNLSRPLSLKKIIFYGLNQLELNDIKWRMASNRLMCNVSVPTLHIEVTFDNVEIELDENFGHEKFNTSINVGVNISDLKIFASVRYNVKAMLTDEEFFIDKAEVDINAVSLSVDIKIEQSLEEVRYVIMQIFNNPLQDILDAVLKVVVKEINKELLASVDPNIISLYLISKIPKHVQLDKNLFLISRQ